METLNDKTPKTWGSLVSGMDSWSVNELLEDAYRRDSMETRVEWNELCSEPMVIVKQPDLPMEGLNLTLREARLLRDQLTEALDSMDRLRAGLESRAATSSVHSHTAVG